MVTAVMQTFTPRVWQNDALRAWIGAHSRGIVEVVTGGGKSKFALMCSSHWLSENPTGIVQVLVPTISLQDQWVVTLEVDLQLHEGEVVTQSDRITARTRFLVLVVNTARTRPPHTKRPLMLVADECHRYASIENSRALQQTWSATLGLSATAEREYDDGLHRTLIPLLGPIIYTYDLAQGLGDGVVSGYSALNIEVELSELERSEYETLSRRLGSAIASDHADAAKRIAMQRSRLVNRAQWRVPAAIALISKHRNRRIMVFCEEIAQVEEIENALSARKHAATIYHSGLSAEIRRDNLRQFRRGVNDIVIACRALDEGVDIPEADMAVIVSSTATRRQRIQRIGRALRTSPGKPEAIVATIFATKAERDRLIEEEAAVGDLVTAKWERIRVA